ncbi:YeiH family protein [Arthrobacter bambusae]|uniref:YeiH family protein n=1 Tax=Arthrobacter bambusae TaxID=1338426 RepID=UPI00278093C8|nr:putative sulfate exporter family transporter [Arthrobacter bambusae]MDQ0210442.1 putative integral membrane protein (TIGR00698 family) [Arthrobacter bambusae]MDQ0234891.1 putative integral membrane protein (TIGR00698 family) [Arthrobacter bambusae]
MRLDVATPLKDARQGALLPRGLRYKSLPGLAASAAAVVVAWLIHSTVPVMPFLTVSVILGILCANLPGTSAAVEGVLQPGLVFSAKWFMRWGIVLLGLKLSLLDVAALGWKTLAIVVGIVLLTFMGTLLLGKALKLPGDQPLLLATGFSICGASAIGAMSGVTKTDHRDTVIPIALVTLCGTLAIAVLPALKGPLGLDTVQFGYWVGASVHDVGQVVATAQTAGPASLAVALIVKLTRVLMLAPMVTGAALVGRFRRRRTANGAGDTGIKLPPLIPFFVAGFMAMIILRTLGILPPVVLEAAGTVQDLLLAAALFGLGASVQVRALLQTSGRAIMAAMLSWGLIAALAFAGVHII